jgi:hypothetical protein
MQEGVIEGLCRGLPRDRKRFNVENNELEKVFERSEFWFKIVF